MLGKPNYMIDLLELRKDEQEALEKVLNTHSRPYMREKASALLQVNSGKRVEDVALYGLLKKRRISTIYSWIKKYKQSGLEGLQVQQGRGRRPSFFSST